ncbi:hypothetical protein JCM11491_003727 [Sporobolomyces phaffii]
MPANVLLVVDLVLSHLVDAPGCGLSRPSVRYSILVRLSLVSRSIRASIDPILYSHVVVSAGNSQLVPLLAALESNPERARQIRRLSLVSRHNDPARWDRGHVDELVELCTEVRELVVAIPTSFGMRANFLNSDALANLTSLTMATPLQPRRPFDRRPRPPRFTLSTLSLLSPFSPRSSLSFVSTVDVLLAPKSDGSSSLSQLVHLDLFDSHHHPLTLPPRLATSVFGTLTTLLLPRHTHTHSYLPRGETRYSCDEPTNVHPSRTFLDLFSLSSASRLKYVYLPSLGHVGSIHHLPRSVERLVIGPSLLPAGEVERADVLEDLGACLINARADLREVGLVLRRASRGPSVEGELRRLVERVEQGREACRVEVVWT